MSIMSYKCSVYNPKQSFLGCHTHENPPTFKIKILETHFLKIGNMPV